MPCKQRLEEVRLSPFSLNHEMHDLVFFHKVAHNNYECYLNDHVMPCTKKFSRPDKYSDTRSTSVVPVEKTKEQGQYMVPSPSTLSGKQIVSLSCIRPNDDGLQNLEKKLTENY